MINSNGIFYNIINKDKNRPLIHSTNKVIGIPRYMQSLPNGKLWLSFFSFLGCTILLSPETNNLIMNDGFELCGDGASMSAAAAAGQIRSLSERCDAVIMPRYVGFEYPPVPTLDNEILPLNLRELVITKEIGDINDTSIQKNLTLASLFSGYPVVETTRILQKYLVDYEKKSSEKKQPFENIKSETIVISGEPLLLDDSFLNKNTVNIIKYNYKRVVVCPFDKLSVICENHENIKAIILVTSKDDGNAYLNKTDLPLLQLFIERHTKEQELLEKIKNFLG